MLRYTLVGVNSWRMQIMPLIASLFSCCHPHFQNCAPPSSLLFHEPMSKNLEQYLKLKTSGGEYRRLRSLPPPESLLNLHACQGRGDLVGDDIEPSISLSRELLRELRPFKNWDSALILEEVGISIRFTIFYVF